MYLFINSITLVVNSKNQKKTIRVFDAWLDSAPGGPLFDLIHSGADTPQVNGGGDRPSEMPVGDQALAIIPVLYDQFVEADLKVAEAKVCC